MALKTATAIVCLALPGMAWQPAWHYRQQAGQWSGIASEKVAKIRDMQRRQREVAEPDARYTKEPAGAKTETEALRAAADETTTTALTEKQTNNTN